MPNRRSRSLGATIIPSHVCTHLILNILWRPFWRLRLFVAAFRIYVCMMSAQAFTLASERFPVLFTGLMTDDTQIIANGLRRRDPELLDLLIEQFQHRLFRYLIFLTGEQALAEDLFQETWIRVMERGHQYNAKSKFESWLFAIARNLVIDVSRRKKFQSLDGMADPESGAPFEPPDDHGLSALQMLVTQENEKSVQLSLLKIPAYYREVLLLRFHEELGLEEIAAVLSTPLSTVKSRLYRGLEALKNVLPRTQNSGAV
jgi:RNA polymerase sigma-70 factor, ECF subfamily